MSAFKDMVQEDIKEIFLDFEMLGEVHKINGIDVMIIIDANELTEREKRIRGMDGAPNNRQLLFYVAAKDFGALPLPGKVIDLDQEDYIITDAEDEMGIYSISLEAKRT